MYRNQRIALVIPAYNEERLIGRTLESVREGTGKLIDTIYVVDDASTDHQADVIMAAAKRDDRITLVRHFHNQGPGAAIITGYRRASEQDHDIVVVVGGDFQMDLTELKGFLDPIVEGRADYTKGNRFLLQNLEQTIERMPRARFYGNLLLTGLTKIASGYFKLMDVVDGYTAISKRAIDTVNWDHAWKRYGYPMDFLIRLNAYGFRVVDVARTAVYLPGERQSQIKAGRYMMRVLPMLVRAFFWRLRFKYVYLDFHPLVLFYCLSFVLLPLGFLGGAAMVVDKLFFTGSSITAARAVLISLALLTGSQFFLFAMLFDRQEAREAYIEATSMENAAPAKPLRSLKRSSTG